MAKFCRLCQPEIVNLRGAGRYFRDRYILCPEHQKGLPTPLERPLNENYNPCFECWLGYPPPHESRSCSETEHPPLPPCSDCEAGRPIPHFPFNTVCPKNSLWYWVERTHGMTEKEQERVNAVTPERISRYRTRINWCGCPSYAFKQICKHIKALRRARKLVEAGENDEQ